MTTTRSRPRSDRKSEAVDLTALAGRLSSEAFREDADRELAALGRKRIDVHGFDLEAAAGDESRLQTRPKEQVLAKCFELLRERATVALEAAGVATAEIAAIELTSQSTRDLIDECRDESSRTFALQCLGELEQLKQIYVGRVGYLVPSIVQKYIGIGVDRDDLQQEGYLGLLRAIEGYDWRRGVRFSTYAKYWIQDRVLKAIYDQSRTVRLPAWIQKLWQKMTRLRSDEDVDIEAADLAGQLHVSKRRLRRVVDSRRAHVSLDAPASEEDGGSFADLLADERTPVELVSDAENLRKTLDAVIDDLPERQASVLKRRFGLRGAVPESLQRIGDDLGLSAERVRQIQQAALGRLRNHNRITPLEDCIA